MYVYFICEIPSIGNIFYGLLFVKSINELKAQLTINKVQIVFKVDNNKIIETTSLQSF